MNRLVIFYGCALLASSAIAEEQQSQWDFNHEKLEVVLNSTNSIVSNTIEALFSSGEPACIPCDEDSKEVDLDINDIDFVTEDRVELGFNPNDYLPANFDPHATYFDIDSIEYVEEENESIAGFDTKEFLPEGFDPYSDIVSVNSINYMEEEELDLGFETSEYLPVGFSAYEAYFNLDDILYIDIEDLEEETSVSSCKPTIKNEPYN